jgi:hypothetical protein
MLTLGITLLRVRQLKSDSSGRAYDVGKWVRRASGICENAVIGYAGCRHQFRVLGLSLPPACAKLVDDSVDLF